MKKIRGIYMAVCVAAAALFCGLIPDGQASACTSAIVGAGRGAGGRWLLWKHRDTGHIDNYVRRIEPTDSTLGYVALFNAADTASLEAWIGFNEAGFAVMNTATYNLPAPAPDRQDREGLIMSEALAACRSLDDFRSLLTGYPSRRGVQANFGAIDADGHGAYFEVSDLEVREFPLDSLTGISTRTNYSFGGAPSPRRGLCRHLSEAHQLDSLLDADRPWAPAGLLAAEDFTEVLSRSFLLPRRASGGFRRTDIPGGFPYAPDDLLEGSAPYAPDGGDVISRRISSASVVIEGPLPGEDPARTTIMWTCIGFPALSVVEPVTLDSVPASLLPSPETGRSPLCDTVATLRDRAILPHPGKKKAYRFDLRYLREAVPARRALSLPRYTPARSRRPSASR